MVDSVRMVFRLPVREEVLRQVKAMPDGKILNEFEVSTCRERIRGVMRRVYRLINGRGACAAIVDGVLCYISASIPRMLFRNNARLILNQAGIDEFVQRIDALVADIVEPGYSRELNYSRIDLVAYLDRPVDEIRPLFRDAEFRLIRKNAIDYSNQGFTLPGALLRVNFYDKELQMGRPAAGRTRFEFQIHGRLLRKALTGAPTGRVHRLDFNQLANLYAFLVGLFPSPLQKIPRKKYNRNELLGLLMSCRHPHLDLRDFVDSQIGFLNTRSQRNARHEIARAAITYANFNLHEHLRPLELFQDVDDDVLRVLARRLLPSSMAEMPVLMRCGEGAGWSNSGEIATLFPRGDCSTLQAQPYNNPMHI